MRSGCPYNHGGSYPAFQHLSDIGALPSPQDNRVTSVVHPANGIQNTMIATQNPGGFRVTYISAPWQQSNTRSQQNFQGLQHQLEFEQYGHSNNSPGAAAQTFHLQDQRSSVPERTRGTSCPLLHGLLSGNTQDWKTVFTNPSCSSKRTHSNTEVNRSNHFSDETCCASWQVRSSLAAPNSGQTRTRNLMHSGETYSTPYQRHVASPHLSSQPFTDEASAIGGMLSPADNQMQDFNAESAAYYKPFSPLNNTNYGHAHCNRGWTSCTDHSVLKSGIMPKSSVSHLLTTSASHNADVESYTVGQCTAAVGQALLEDNSKGGKAKLTPKYKETGDCAESTPGNHSTEYPQILMNAAATQTKNEEQRPVALTALPGMTLDKVTEKPVGSTLNRRASQEGHRSMGLNINNTLVGMDKVRSVSLIPKHKSKREKGDTDMGSDNMQDVTGLLGYHQTTSSSVVSENKTFELSPRVDKIQIHNIVSLHPANSQSQWPCNQTSGAGAGGYVGSVRSQTALSIQLAQNKVKEHVPLGEIKAKDALSVKCLKNPQYEDISDEDIPQQHTEPVREDLSFAARFEDPLYDDVSEDENAQIENMAEERPSLLRVPEPYNKQSLLKNEGYPHVQGQAQMETEIIRDEQFPKEQVAPKTGTTDTTQYCTCPCFAETDDALEGPLCPICDCKRPLGWQINHSAPRFPSSVLENEGEADDQIDDDWVVLPISMSDLRFEPDDEDQDWPGPDDCETRDKEKPSDTNQIHSELHFPARKPEAAPASPPLEVFDTLESFLQAKGAQFKNKVVASDWSTPEHEMDGEPRVYQKRRKSCSEPEDSCETEDSCDYSSGSEHNYLTVSRKLLKKRSAPLASKTNDSESEQEGQHDEATTVRKARSKRVKHEPIEQKSSQQDDIIILDSDTEDESDQNYETNAKWCRFNPSSSEDGGDNPCSQRSHSPESVGSRSGRFQEKVNIRRPSPSDSPAPQHQSKPNDTKWKEAVPVARSDPSHSTEKSGQNGQRNINGQQSSKKIDIIILDSDMEDDNDENCGNADMKELFLGSEDSGDATRVQWKRPSTETVDSEDGTAKEKHSSAGPSVPRGDVTKDERSDVLHSTKKTKPLIEAAGGSENVQHTTNRQTVSEKVVEKAHFRKKRPHRKKVLSSSEDDGDDLSATKNRPSTETEDYHCGTAKPKKPRVSPEDAPKKRPQSVDKEAASSSSRGSMNPRVVLMPFSPADHKLKLVKESRFHVQAKDKPCASKTPTAPRPKADSCEKKTQNLHRHKEGKCTSKTKSATDATKKKVQTNTEKPRLVLLPSQRHSSTSVSRSSHTGGQLPESRQSSSSSRWLSQSGETSAASRLPAPKQNTSIPRQPILQRSHSHSGPSTSGRHQAPSKGPLSSATSKLSAKKQVTADWQKSFSPTKRDRKFSLGMERDFHTTNYDSVRDTRTQPSRSDKSATPLMKKSKSDAIELTKAIRRDAPRKPGYPVGQGYKWSEKPAVKRPTKGSRREEKRRRSPQRRRF